MLTQQRAAGLDSFAALLAHAAGVMSQSRKRDRLNLKPIINSVVIIFALSLVGCSSLRSYNDSDGSAFASVVYPGVRLNSYYWACHNENFKDEWKPLGIIVMGTFYYLPDFLLSSVIDTVLLPYSIYNTNERGSENFPPIKCEHLPKYFG